MKHLRLRRECCLCSAVDGTGNHTAYSFYHWAGIDIFCYFSHHLVTVPPLGWINVAHAHGVKVIGNNCKYYKSLVKPTRLTSYQRCRYDRRYTCVPIICAGTIITEWAEGALFWDEVLSSEINLQNFISVLVTIAKTLKFDGWLLNIENKVKIQTPSTG